MENFVPAVRITNLNVGDFVHIVYPSLVTFSETVSVSTLVNAALILADIGNRVPDYSVSTFDFNSALATQYKDTIFLHSGRETIQFSIVKNNGIDCVFVPCVHHTSATIILIARYIKHKHNKLFKEALEEKVMCTYGESVPSGHLHENAASVKDFSNYLLGEEEEEKEDGDIRAWDV